MNVYLMPNIGLNLFSIETAKTKGITVRIERGTLQMTDKKGRMLGHARRAGKLYYLEASTIKHTQMEEAMPAIQNNKISRATWHR